MATQCKGWPAGGAFTTVNKDGASRAQKTTTFGVTLAPGNQNQALHAINVWLNSAGAGTHSLRAQKIAHAQGIQLQEV